MHRIIYLLIFTGTLFACTQKAKIQPNHISLNNYELFGEEEISLEQPKTKQEALKVFESLEKGEQVPLRFETSINEVCVKKGCWMKLDLGNNEEAFIKMKDYAFFVPKDVSGKTVIVDGVAELQVTSIDQLKHYAKDAGKSTAEIEKINEPKKTYFLMANSVLISKK